MRRDRDLDQARVTLQVVFAGMVLLAPSGAQGQFVSGIVMKFGTDEPATGASVALLDADQNPVATAVTDSVGWFGLDAQADGVYSLTVQLEGHSSLWREGLSVTALDPLDLEFSLKPLGRGGMGTGTEAQIRAVIERSVASTCGGRFDPGVHGILTGQITDSDTDVPLPGVPVTLVWREASDTAPEVTRSATAFTDYRGIYLFCSAPGGTAVLATVSTLGRDEVTVTVGIKSGAVHREDVALELNDPDAPGFLFGSMIDQETRRPVSGAEVRIKDTDFRTLTDDNGFFSISDVPWGVYELVVDHIAYAHVEQAFRVQGSRGHQIDLTMVKEAIELEPLTVTIHSRRWYNDMEGMQRRLAAGFGSFISPEQIELRSITRLSDALREVPGVRVRKVGLYGSIVTVRGQSCVPQVFVDGRLYQLDPVMLFDEPFGLDIYAIEVYKGAASVPGEFAYGNDTCAAVVVWTKRGR